MSKCNGFTLVELMVVVLIIGVLVAVAIPVFNHAQMSASRTTCHTNQRVLEGAVQQWIAAEPNNVWLAQVIDGNDSLTSAGDAYVKNPPECTRAVGRFYGVDSGGEVTADDLASGDSVPGAWTSATGHDHY